MASSTVEEKRTFNSEAEAGRLPFKGDSPEKAYAHGSTRGFYVYVSTPDADGNVQRWYGIRYGTVGPSGKRKDTKKKLGTVGLLAYGKALQQATAALERAREARDTGKPVLPTLKEAFDEYLEFKTTLVANEKKLKPPTVKDYTDRFHDLVPLDWHNRPLDELTADVWGHLRRDCTTTRSFDVRLRKPVSEGRFDVMMKGPISGLYRRQRETLHPTLANPVPLMRQQGMLSSTKQRHDFIPTEALPAVWNFLETEMRPPQRDITLIGLLTGWRLQLITAIPLDRIKEKKRAVEWRDTDEGGPYAEKDGPAFDYPVSDFLWDKVFAPRLAALRPGQKYLIESGRKPGSPFRDVRDSVRQLDPIVGCHVSAQVLRKTCITLAPASGAPQRSISHNVMHKTSSGSAATGGSDTTSSVYQKRDFQSMKTAANRYADWFSQQVGVNAAPAAAGIEGLSLDKVAALQKLADMPADVLAKILRMADALK